MGFPIGLTNNGLYFQASGVADDFPTLHAAQAQFGGGFFLVPNDPAVRSLADGTILLGSRDFFSSHTNDLPADGFVLAIDQPGALKGTLADLSGDPVAALAPGQQFSGVIATFTDPRLDVDPSEFTGRQTRKPRLGGEQAGPCLARARDGSTGRGGAVIRGSSLGHILSDR